ncbi:MAG: hypothetical protein ACREID_02195 [Planctomycetota bacterium]
MRTLIPLILCAASAAADVVLLKDGRTISGRVLNEEGKIIVVDRDRKYAVKRSDVERIDPGASFMDEYEARLEKLPAEDAEAIFEFGRWLEENDWASRARRAFEEVLELDADHRGARRALGYSLFEGEWVSAEELNLRKGLVEFEGTWYTPHDLAELKAEIGRNEQLRQSIEERRKVNEKINQIARGFASFEKPKRQKAYDELYRYAERLNSPELRKFADDTKAYYDDLVKVLCAQMRAKTEIRAVHTRLKRPIETFETGLGQAIAFISGQAKVKIQLPELTIAQIQTTVEIPAGCD